VPLLFFFNVLFTYKKGIRKVKGVRERKRVSDEGISLQSVFLCVCILRGGGGTNGRILLPSGPAVLLVANVGVEEKQKERKFIPYSFSFH
jgi:hypothetical protein